MYYSVSDYSVHLSRLLSMRRLDRVPFHVLSSRMKNVANTSYLLGPLRIESYSVTFCLHDSEVLCVFVEQLRKIRNNDEVLIYIKASRDCHVHFFRFVERKFTRKIPPIRQPKPLTLNLIPVQALVEVGRLMTRRLFADVHQIQPR